MRFSTLLSFLVAAILAGMAVYGAQSWLDSERQQFSSLVQQPTEAPEPEAPKNTIVVANESFTFGERVTVTKLREIEWSGNIVPNGAFKTIEELVVNETEEEARFAITSIEAGEPILSTKVTDPGQRAKLSTALTPGMKAVSIAVNDVLGVAGFVLPGDRVDVLLTRGSSGSKFVDVLLQGVRVLAIDQIADDRKDKPSVVRTVTFEVSTAEAQKLVLGASVGTLSLTLRNVASTDVENIDRITLGDLDDKNVAAELARIKAEEAKQKREAEAARLAALQAERDKSDPSAERIAELEALLKNLSEGIENRINGVEQKIQGSEPASVAEEVVVNVVPQGPTKAKVGVIRNGQRAEYKVIRKPGEEANEAAASMVLGNPLDEETAAKLEGDDEDTGATGILVSQ